MPRTIKLITAAIAIVLAAAVVSVIAYDRGRDHTQTHSLRYDLSLQTRAPIVAGNVRGDVTLVAGTVRYRVQAAPKTVINLGQKRNGCTLTRLLPAEAVCDLAVAFPDVGLDRTVSFVGTARANTSSNTLTFNLGN